MAAVEVWTIGGGEYIVNVFNAVAAWTGAGGYKSMIQAVIVMAFAMATMVIAFDSNWRAWINWFLQATLMYMCLMVPRLDVQVVDRINPGLAPSYVANVPLGLAMMASFTSQIGDYLTTSAEVVFGLPVDQNYSANGMVYGARLLEATQNIAINDAEFAANLDEHMRQCVFYDVLLGRKSMSTLSAAPDLWAALAPGSVSRAQKFLTRDVGSGLVTSEIKTCRDAYNAMDGQWAAPSGPLDKVIGPLSRSLYPQGAARRRARQAARRSGRFVQLHDRRIGSRRRHPQADAADQRDDTGHAHDGRRQRRVGDRRLCADPRRDPDAQHLFGDQPDGDQMGAAAAYRVDRGVLRAVPGDLPAVPDAQDGGARTQGLCHRLLLSRRLGAVVRHPCT